VRQPAVLELSGSAFPSEDRLNDVLDDRPGGRGQGLFADEPAIDQRLGEVFGVFDAAPRFPRSSLSAGDSAKKIIPRSK
jgi:hypothetical protein